MSPVVTLTLDVEGDFETSALRGVDEVLPRLLDAFEARAMRAVLFAVGTVAQRRPAVLRAAAERGHVVGAHGMTHVRLSSLDLRAREAEVREARAAVADATGQACDCFRAPFFDAPRDLGECLEAAGYRWSSSTAPFSPVAGYRHAHQQRPRRWAGTSVVEVPVPGFLGLPLPQGLSYHRLFPRLTGLPAPPPKVFYLHPYELLDRVEGFNLPRWMRPFVLARQGPAAERILWSRLDAWRARGAVFAPPSAEFLATAQRGT